MATTQEAITRILDDRERQGLERTVTDPSALRAVARLLASRHKARVT